MKNDVRFVNITTNQFWCFESWEEISSLGGLKKLLPKEEWKDIYNEKASKETYMSMKNGFPNKDIIQPYEKSLFLFENKKD